MAEAEHYRILGVAPGATVAELKSAYRKLVMAYHPDSPAGTGNAQTFLRVVQAYQSLMGRQTERAPIPRPPRPAQPARRAAAPPDLFALGRALLLGRDPRERASAAAALGASGRKSSYAFLRKALWDRDDRVLIAVVRAVGRLDIRQSAGELGSLFSKASPLVKKEILSAVMRMGAAGGFESLLRIGLRDPDPGVRVQAQKARDGAIAGAAGG